MVLLDPPAPAARDDVGLGAVGARRLKIMRKCMMSFLSRRCRVGGSTYRTALAPGGRDTAEETAPPPEGELGRGTSAC